MAKTIKEIYNYDYVINPETSLLKHINKVLDKTPNELNVDDICMLVRQERFLDIVIDKAIDLLIKDSKVGDYYDYCLLHNLARMDADLTPYKDRLVTLIKKLEDEYKTIKFEDSDCEEDYLSSLTLLKDKIK